jgi:curved DNA-binding protein CbpA
MDYKRGFEIMEINLSVTNYNDITLEYLKKQYRKLILKNHPDKNGNTPESNEKFKNIHEAYHYLKKEISREHFENTEEGDDDREPSLYFDILTNFMKTVFQGQYTDVLSKIVNDIINAGKKISVKLFDDLDKDTALNIYTFLSNYRSVLHLSQEIMDMIRDVVVKKYDNVEVYKLNPSISDLINNNVYKLYVNDELFLVPLWHNELHFESSGCEIIVICDPELPIGLSIDDDNNIQVETTIPINELQEKIINNGFINIDIGGKKYNIPLDGLYMKREQYYKIKNAGLSKIKRDIYDVVEKTDIIVKITMV